MLYTEQDLFCFKYLKERGLLSTENLVLMGDELPNLTVSFDLVRVENDDFFTTLAKPLRELWPQGDKDDKYPWRMSVKDAANRLSHLWRMRNLGKYSVEDCLTVARKYLAQFERDSRYMKTLRYFIMKQKSIVAKDGRITYITESPFADMLESFDMTSFEDQFNSTSTFDQGELV